ncbi:hypothetical protein PS3A_02590 [Pseudomonas sp. 3A(2025)]
MGASCTRPDRSKNSNFEFIYNLIEYIAFTGLATPSRSESHGSADIAQRSTLIALLSG